MGDRLTEREKFQEAAFDRKAGRKRIYAVGGRDNRNHAIKIDRILGFLDLGADDHVLEVGLGEGEHARLCLERTPCRFTGIDISRETVDVAAGRLAPFAGRFTVQRDNANRLSFDDAVFDAVFCAATLHHMEEPQRMVSEMSRVLKPGGRIAIMEPNWIYPTNIVFSLLLEEDRNMRLMRRGRIHAWLERAGIGEIAVEHLIYTPPVPTALIPLYDRIDRIAGALPVVKRCSLMLFGRGVKK